MKSIKYYVMALIAFVVVSCQQAEKAPMSINMTIGQCDVSGSQSSIVRIDTATYVLTRDSVVDEERDTIYTVSLPVTLHLDSEFITDKAEDTPQLELKDSKGTKIAELELADTAAIAQIIEFMKGPDRLSGADFIEVKFTGKLTKSQFLKARNVTNLTLAHFHFHQIDPESLADPKITELLKNYEECVNSAQQYVNDGMGYSMAMMQLGEYTEDIKAQLQLSKGKMTAKQLEKFVSLSTRLDKILASRE